MEEKTKKAEATFEERYKSFKEGNGEAPIMHKTFQVKSFIINDGKKVAIISREEKDRDGETVKMDGVILRSWIVENGIPMIDSHNSFGSVVENGLGAFRNPRIEDVDGGKAFVADPDFAPTENGKTAEILYMGVDGGKPYFTNISMGFAVTDYDNETREIKGWEPYECSLVTVGANMSSRFIDKSAKVEDKKEEEKIDEQAAKDLSRFKQIHAPFKLFTKLFLDESFMSKLGIAKDGNLEIDINSLYDTIDKKFTVTQEAPKVTKEAPNKLTTKATTDDITKATASAIAELVKKELEKLS